MTQNKNFTNQPTPSIIDTEYQNCNFTQHVPVDAGGGVRRGVRLFPGDDTPRTFINCNLCNAEPPPGSTVTSCNTTIAEFYVETDTETVTIDGVPETVQHHSNFIYGRWTPAGYVDNPSPVEIEVD